MTRKSNRRRQAPVSVTSIEDGKKDSQSDQSIKEKDQEPKEVDWRDISIDELDMDEEEEEEEVEEVVETVVEPVKEELPESMKDLSGSVIVFVNGIFYDSSFLYKFIYRRFQSS